MEDNKKVSLMLNIPKSFRDKLRKMAAEQNLKNPDQVTSASTIAREIVCAYFDNGKADQNSCPEEEQTNGK